MAESLDIAVWIAAAERIWAEGYLGIDVVRFLTTIVIVAVAMATRPWLARFVTGRIRSALTAVARTRADAVVHALEAPLTVVPLFVGLALAAAYLDPKGTAEIFVDRVLQTLLVGVIFWTLYRLVTPFAFVFEDVEKRLQIPVGPWLRRSTRVAVAFIGSATVLEVWGIDVGAVLAGLGLLGVAVALGAQDMFKNMIAGLLILAERRFVVGDWVLVQGLVEGTVEDIGFRSTRIRRFDQAPVYVPNAALSDNAVINYSLLRHRRIYWMIALEYRSTAAQLKAVRDGIEEYIRSDPAFVPPDNATSIVRVDSFNDSSIDLMIYCFTRTTVWTEWLEVKERLLLKIKQIVEEADTAFAFPSRTLYVENAADAPPRDIGTLLAADGDEDGKLT